MTKKKNGFGSFKPDQAQVEMKNENHNGSRGKITTAKEVRASANNK